MTDNRSAPQLNQSEAWRSYEQRMARLNAQFDDQFMVRRFPYLQSIALQSRVAERLRKAYSVPVAYTDWGPRDAPVLICLGGVANSAMRFSFLCSVLRSEFRVISMDWLGRGQSGWLADAAEYGRGVYVEQLTQLLEHLRALPGCEAIRRGPVNLLGSSMGGTAAIDFCARAPFEVAKLVLNDVGPSIPKERRQRRGEAIARFYVFRSPEDLTRRAGAAQKNDGPISDDVRAFISHHQTRWSEDHGGRIYAHDIRALMTYRQESSEDVDQWAAWRDLHTPVLLLHGVESDALSLETIERMHHEQSVVVAHVPDTGHTPALSDVNQAWLIKEWLADRLDTPGGCEFSLPYAGDVVGTGGPGALPW